MSRISSTTARRDHRYKILFETENPTFALKTANRLEFRIVRLGDKLGFWRFLTSPDLTAFAALINADDVRSSASDRINPDAGPQFLCPCGDLDAGIDASLNHLSARVFSEEPALTVHLKRTLPCSLHFTQARSENGKAVPDEYLDLFASARCSWIIHAGAPSSICLIAALIGGKNVDYVYLPEDFQGRFPVEYRRIDPS